jgi:DNA polymerase III alpha subunit (gram-positive type)
MRFLGIDLETTGLDISADRILKLGICLYDHKDCVLEREWTLFEDTYPPIKPEAFAVHGIKLDQVREFGDRPNEFFPKLAILIKRSKVDYMVAHNGTRFDFPMLLKSIERDAPESVEVFKHTAKIDTALDLPVPETIQTRKLVHLAAEHGFLNPFPHSTLSDVKTMMSLFFRYPIEETLKRAASPTITIQAKVNFSTRELAKARRYAWDTDNQRWLKKVKLCDLEQELDGAEFEIVQLQEEECPFI